MYYIDLKTVVFYRTFNSNDSSTSTTFSYMSTYVLDKDTWNTGLSYWKEFDEHRLNNEVSELGQKVNFISPLVAKIGEKTSQYTITEFANIIYINNVVENSTVRWNGVLIPIVPGSFYSFNRGRNPVVFGDYPSIGDTGTPVSNDFTAQSGQNYLLITFDATVYSDVTITTNAIGVLREVETLKDALSKNIERIGTISETKEYSEYTGLMHDGIRVALSTDRFNSILLSIVPGASYSWTVGLNVAAFENIPEIGDTGTLVSSGFTAQSGQNYLLITIPVSSGSTKVTVNGSGILGEKLSEIELNVSKNSQNIGNVSTIVLTSADFSGIGIDGSNDSVFSATSNFNGFIIPIKPGNEYSWIQNGKIYGYWTLQTRPNVGDTVSPIRKCIITAQQEFQIKAKPLENYIFIMFDMRNVEFQSLEFSIREGLSAGVQYANPLFDKTIVCFGDSITQFSDLDFRFRYSDWLMMKSGANVINVGIGGSTLLQRQQNLVSPPTTTSEAIPWLDIISLVRSACDRNFDNVDIAATMVLDWRNDPFTPIINRLKSIDFSKVDIVTIFGGTNDFSFARLGQSGSVDITTTIGAINYITEILLTTYPNIKLYWFTPIIRWWYENFEDRLPEQFSDVKTNSAGQTLKNYAEAIKVECLLNHIPVCDMYNTLGWNKFNFGKYFPDFDGTHPRKGFEQIAEKFKKFLESE